MARTRATIHCSIHSDPDWLALSPSAKLLYLTVTSQPTVTLAGCLDYNPAKWAKYTGLDMPTTIAAVDELATARFLIVDDDTFEAVIRTFTVHDVGTKANRNTVRGMISAWNAILSPTLRQVVLDAMPERLRQATEEATRVTNNSVAKTDTATVDQSTDAAPVDDTTTADGTGVRTGDETTVPTVDRTDVVITASSTSTSTATKTLSRIDPAKPRKPDPQTGSPPSASESPPRETLDAQFDRFWDVYPRKVGKQAARKAWDRARKRRPPDAIQSAVEASLPAWKTMDQQFIPHPATWLTQGRYDDPPPTPETRSTRPPPSNAAANRQRITAAIARLEGAGT